MLEGSCLCGGVRYEITGELVGRINYCHCSQCRKASGSSFGTTAGVNASDFRIVAGEGLVSSWESSPGNHRCFCSRCGSPLFKRVESSPAILRLRLGTLDTDPGVKVERHIYVRSKAPWVEIVDDLSQYEDAHRRIKG